MCSASCRAEGSPNDPALEPPEPESRVAIEDAPEDVLAEGVAEGGDGLQHPDADHIELTRSRGWALADMVRHRDFAPPRSRATPRPSRCWHSRWDASLSPSPAGGMRNVLNPKPFSSLTVRRSRFGIPPIDQADPVDAVVRSFLDLCDVLVVDPEASSRTSLSGHAEQGEDRIREDQLLGDALRIRARRAGHRRHPCVSPTRGRTA